MPIDTEFRKAREQGIDVGQVGQSWAHHLSEARRKTRDEARQTGEVDPPDSLAVLQKNGATAVYWETMGTLPYGVLPLKVWASSHEASINRESVKSLLERRYKREFAIGLIQQGTYENTLEGRRNAMARAMRAQVYIADTGLVP